MRSEAPECGQKKEYLVEHAVPFSYERPLVEELFPSLRNDFLLFFDHVAFADNPDWSDCHCSAYHFANKGEG